MKVPPTLRLAVAATVHALRDRAGLSLRDLADLAGISPPMISRIERAERMPTIASAWMLAVGAGGDLVELAELVITVAASRPASLEEARVSAASQLERLRGKRAASRLVGDRRRPGLARPWESGRVLRLRAELAEMAERNKQEQDDG